MDTKILTLNEFIEKAYNNFKDRGHFEDLNEEELTTMLLIESKNLLNQISYANHKVLETIQSDILKRIFKNIGILAKINDINLEE